MFNDNLSEKQTLYLMVIFYSESGLLYLYGLSFRESFVISLCSDLYGLSHICMVFLSESHLLYLYV